MSTEFKPWNVLQMNEILQFHTWTLLEFQCLKLEKKGFKTTNTEKILKINKTFQTAKNHRAKKLLLKQLKIEKS